MADVCSQSSRKVAILGGGITGITAGALLEACGYRTTLYTAHRLDDMRPGRVPPELASRYPAASVIPHTVTIRDLPAHLRCSQQFFEALRRAGTFGVRRQHHYEVFERPTEAPAYAGIMKNFRLFPPGGKGARGTPRRRGAEGVYGWHFDVLFAEMPAYLLRLYALYEAAGGTIVQRRVGRSDLRGLEAEAVLNCTGRWTTELFDDPRPWTVVRGHLVRVERPGPLLNRATGARFSYNYTPVPAVYESDVYCYPRSDDWVLGGARQEGRPQIGAAWEGEAFGPSLRVGTAEVPAPLLRLNRQLIQDAAGIDIAPHAKHAEIGYRFVRDLGGEGVRLEVTKEKGLPVVHNYGHGGAGVALSWSCAVVVERLLRHEAGVQPQQAGAAADGGLLGTLRRLARRAAVPEASSRLRQELL